MTRDHQADDRTSDGLVALLTVCQRSLSRVLGNLFDDEDTTVDQWRVLRALARDGQAMGDLAHVVELPHPTVTRIVDSLSERALVYRTQGDPDRRRVWVRLSSRGTSLLERLDAVAAAHEAALRDRVGADELDTLTRSLALLHGSQAGLDEPVASA